MKLCGMQEWPFHVSWGPAAQREACSGLEPVPEEAASSPLHMKGIAGCLLFALGLESAGSSIMNAVPTGECLTDALCSCEISMRRGLPFPHVVAA